MAMYLNVESIRRNGFGELGVDLRFIQGPPVTAPPWTHVWVYYLAMQIDFYNDAGTNVGGGHFGLQAIDNPDLGSNPRTVINWGVYDNTVVGPYATFRSTNPIDSQYFIDYNHPTSFGFGWQYGEWIRFRVFRSPKQDWVANEIRAGDLQVPPYVGTDQQADEFAYRLTLENLTKGTRPVALSDVLVKGVGDRPCRIYGCWLEALGDDDLYRTFYYSPICDIRMWDLDGTGVIDTFKLNYYTGPAGQAINCDITSVSGSPGYVRFEGRGVDVGGMTQTTANDTIIAPPTGFWDARPANVSSDIHDVAARVATTRPWY